MTGIHPITRLRARKLRTEMTPQERRLWAKLRELNRMLGLHFRRQAPIGPFIADFADLGRRLVIEVDGSGHGGPRDAARDEWLSAQGFQMLRFWNPEVSGNIEGVMQVIFDAIDGESLAEGVPPTPIPSPRGGGEALGASGAREKQRVAHGADAPSPHPSPTRGEGGAALDASSGTDEPGASPPPSWGGDGGGGPPSETRVTGGRE
ncbi:endonuclease domain-containing protein [Rhodobacter calidifons]|uniref:Endonuclease domain-containing protein n=1 Tax=Rhodobacter calidifons TaxID=2715277 RepID=A0ABX0G3H2_9RHOB|nr:endonuclease domain-containing protein [Rhodobacter calidifons]